MGGVAWDYLNFVLGLHQLGHEVYYVEDSGEWPYLDSGPDDEPWIAQDVSGHVEYLARTFSGFGLGDRWAYFFPIAREWYGMSDRRRDEVIRSADVLLNVSGTLDYPEKYRDVGRLVYIDTDPVFTQIALIQGAEQLRARGVTGQVSFSDCAAAETEVLHDWSRDEKLRRRVDLHDVHFTVGETLPPALRNTGHTWHPTKHPIVLGEWRTECVHRGVYTTIANWTSYEPLVYQGQRYGQKDIEMVRFLGIARAVAPAKLEIALAPVQHSAWESWRECELPGPDSSEDSDPARDPHALLRKFGWNVVPANQVCGDFSSYRDFIRSSKGEWSVAKQGYVCGTTGWFSGRSGCYLAAGRPVIVQDTGFSSIMPTGDGVLAFRGVDEACEQIRAVDSDYGHHARAARAMAAEYFDSSKVLRAMLSAC
jgi:hypothetical protein